MSTASSSTSALSSARLSGLLLVGAEVAIFQWWPAWCRPALLTGHHQVQEVHQEAFGGQNKGGHGRHVLPLLAVTAVPWEAGLRVVPNRAGQRIEEPLSVAVRSNSTQVGDAVQTLGVSARESDRR